MGCWNGTCFISNMSINAGDPVVGFIVERGYGTEACCYSTGHGHPVSMPIFGKYDDYGSIEEIEENWATEHTRKQFVEYLTDEKYEAQYDDYYFIPGEKESFEDIVTSAERGFSIKQQNKYFVSTQPRQSYDLALMHRSVWEGITSPAGTEEWPLFYKKVNVKITKKKQLDALMEDLREPEAIEPEKIVKLRKEIIELMNSIDLFEDIGMGRDTIFGRMTMSGSELYGSGIGWFADFAAECDDDDIEVLARYSSLFGKMSDLRKTWAGPSGKGSQHDNYKEIMELADIMKMHAYLKIKERDNYD